MLIWGIRLKLHGFLDHLQQEVSDLSPVLLPLLCLVTFPQASPSCPCEGQWPHALCLWSPWVVMEFLRITTKTLWAPRVWFLLCCSQWWDCRRGSGITPQIVNTNQCLCTALPSCNVKMQLTKHLALEAWQAEGKAVLEWKPFYFSCLLIYVPSECCHLAKCLLCFCQDEVAAGKN